MDSTPENIGYDNSDGPTKNKDGVLIIILINFSGATTNHQIQKKSLV